MKCLSKSEVTRQAVPSPVSPVISSIVFDQAAYSPGQLITVTINYLPGTSASTQTFTGTGKDSATGKTGALTVNFTIVVNDTTTVTVADSGSRVWTKVSDSGSVAVFTATA